MRERRLFQEAVEIRDAQQRNAFLLRECGGDTALLSRTKRLLESASQMGDFLSCPVLELDSNLEKQLKTTAIESCQVMKGRDMPANHDNESVNANSGRSESAELKSLRPLLSPSDAPGSLGRLAHYDVQQVQGQGGFGIVLRGRDSKLQRLVALKVLLPSLANTSPPRKRFLREALAAASIRHENVVSVYSVDEEPIPFLVMEFIGGQNLQERVDDAGPLELNEIFPIARQLFAGLEAAHAAGIIHRDIKPSNILIEDGARLRVKITDFGLARTVDDASLTQTGYISGTPMYMSPEQAQGSAVDTRSDLFGIGSVLYLMLTGRPPFRAPTTLAVLKRVVDDTPRPIEQIVPDVPEWIRGIVSKLHSKQPKDRFQSAAEARELWEACETRWLRGEPLSDELRRSCALPSNSSVAPAHALVRTITKPHSLRKWARTAIFIPVVSLSFLVCIFLAIHFLNRGSELPKDSNSGSIQGNSVKKGDLESVAPLQTPSQQVDALSLAGAPKTNRETIRVQVPSIGPTDFRIIRGANRESLLAWAKELNPSFIPISMNPRYGTNPMVMDAVAMPNWAKANWQLHDIVDSEADFQQMWRSHRPAWRMQVLDGYENPTRTLFMWVEDIPYWRTFLGSREQIHSQANDLSVEKFFPTSLYGCQSGNRETWTLTQAPMPEFDFRSFPDLDARELELEIDLFRSRDWMPIRMMQHAGFAEPRFAVVFRQNPGKAKWDYSVDVSEEDWEQLVRDYGSKGMYPATVASYVLESKVLYRIIWSSLVEPK